MNCEHCGWSGPEVDMNEMKMDVLEGMPNPPPFPVYQPHPPECKSQLKVGDAVFWDLGPEVGQLPPIQAEFLAITGFNYPDLALTEEGKWKIVREPHPTSVKIKVVAETVLPQHIELLGDQPEDGCWEASCGDITPARHWPVIMS